MITLNSSLNPSYFWPGCFAKGDELDHLMIQSLGRYGDEFIIDCRVMEISRAIEKRPSALLSQSIIEASTPPSLPSHLQEVIYFLFLFIFIFTQFDINFNLEN